MPGEGPRIRQQVIATLGWLTSWRGRRQPERLPRLGALRRQGDGAGGDAGGCGKRGRVRRLGPGLVFEPLWRPAAAR
jgi:hypothetical protein